MCKYSTNANIESEALNRTRFYRSEHCDASEKIIISGHDETHKNQPLIKCECANTTMRVGMVLFVRPYDTIYIYSDKHTSSREEIKISPPNLPDEARFGNYYYN